MIRNFRGVFGVFLIAAFLTMASASSAQAQWRFSASHSFSHSVGSTVSGSGGPVNINCSNWTLSSTTIAEHKVDLLGTAYLVEHLTTSVVINGCEDGLGRTVDVSKNTLTYNFTTGANKGLVDVTGELVTTVTTSFGHCTVTTKGPQTINGISYTNNPDKTVTITANSNNIHLFISGGGFACGTSSTTTTTGTNKGSTVLKGGGGAVAISIM